MLEFVRNMKIFGSEDLLWLLSYWSRDIPPGNVRLIFGMSMVVIQTLITNFTLLCHVYVEGFDHQMWHTCMTGFQLLWIVTGASCIWGQETHTPEFFPERLISLTWGVHDLKIGTHCSRPEVPSEGGTGRGCPPPQVQRK